MAQPKPKGWIDDLFPQARKVTFQTVLDWEGIIDGLSSNGKEGAAEELKGICPIPSHTGKKRDGAFSINPSKQIFNCLQCGKKGNIIAFAQAYRSIESPKEAAEWLLEMQEKVDAGEANGAKSAATDDDHLDQLGEDIASVIERIAARFAHQGARVEVSKRIAQTITALLRDC